MVRVWCEYEQRRSFARCFSKGAATFSGRIAAAALGLALLATTPVGATEPLPDPQPKPFSGPSTKDEAAFALWIEDFKKQALASGLSEKTLTEAFADVKLNPKVLKADAFQPEFSKPIWSYLDGAASPYRIKKGKEALETHKDLFAELQEKYEVQSRFIVAIWGLETSFGAITGDYSVIEALATLAFHGRRAKFGRIQLMAALEIIEAGDKSAAGLTGSWAGAMGHGQFIPTTYLAYAIDHDGDGKRDIWDNQGDAFASISNYLAQSGWQSGQDWGREVKLPEGFDFALADRRTLHTMKEWRAAGLAFMDEEPVPDVDRSASVIVPAGHKGPAFLIFENFRAVLRYNNSTAYALAIGLIADQAAGGPAVQKEWPRDLKPLSKTDRKELQTLLTKRGISTGGVDGIIGGKTRSAIRTFQTQNGMIADGFATTELLDHLNGKASSPASDPASPETLAPDKVPPTE